LFLLSEDWTQVQGNSFCWLDVFSANYLTLSCVLDLLLFYYSQLLSGWQLCSLPCLPYLQFWSVHIAHGFVSFTRSLSALRVCAHAVQRLWHAPNKLFGLRTMFCLFYKPFLTPLARIFFVVLKVWWHHATIFV
jgi:hypothetical protein